METQALPTPVRTATPFDTLALAVASGMAGVALVLLSEAVMGAMWGMAGGGGSYGPGSMMGAYGSRTMMGGGFGFLIYAVVVGFVGGAFAGAVIAATYNNLVARKA
jgi:hypothetical protein